ncbi:MAG TPA: alpha/beta hydrolase [Longimicrobiaceae bacterium]|nr:alpha/beta hydrolase [Longimicrobiaceae bacterium]
MNPPREAPNTVQVAGRSLRVQIQGEGPPVLLIHGIPTNGELWRDVMPRLAERARVIAVDMLGYGRSEPPRGLPVDIGSHAAYLVEMLDTLQIERATVVGHDIGGGVAQILAVRYPERVERLGLVNSVCYDSWPIPSIKAIQATAPVFEHLPAGLTTEGLKLGLRRGFVHQERAEEFLDLFLEPFSSGEGLEVFVEHARALDSRQTEEIAPQLSMLRIPAAVVWGEQDPFQKVHWAERLAGDIPTAELTRIEDSSHFAPADAPDEVAEALLRLLERPVEPAFAQL